MRRASAAPPPPPPTAAATTATAAAAAPPQTHKESSTSTRPPARSRDDKKVTTESATSKSTKDDRMDSTKAASASATSSSTVADDVYEFKSVKDGGDSSPEPKSEAVAMETDNSDNTAANSATTAPPGEESASGKRNFAEVSESADDNGASAAAAGGNDEESRRKKRKEETNSKDGKNVGQRNAGQTKGQSGKQTTGNQNKSAAVGVAKNATAADKKSPCGSPKPASTSDAEVEDGKTDLKVPPLKIVIPQSTAAEQESGTSRNGKNSSQRAHQALPYVVASSNSNDSNDKDMVSGTGSPEAVASAGKEEKKDVKDNATDERGGSSHQRVLRSSHRSGTNQGTDRGSNNSSPQLQRSHSPSPSASPAAPSNQNDTPASTSTTTSSTTSKSSDSQANQNAETEATTSASTSTSTTTTTQAPAVELHPRKRKMKPNKEPPAPAAEPAEAPAEAPVHPHDQPITNCYQLFLDIKKQIAKRRRSLFPVQPKPPQGFKDYLMNRCTYVLQESTPSTPSISYPPSLPPPMKDLFTDQEKERYKLRMQHVVEKEKLVLSVEQEILRVHGRAARALANQSLPFSVCTILRDEEVYNLITPEQEEKDRNARSRYNGRLFLSWLQDVDDKWEKIKEAMLLRHHNEAESLNAVQKMDWEWKMKELSLCDRKSVPSIDTNHVPMVHVSDDFDLLPA